MKINKLIVRGPLYQRTLNFSAGLNIISGEKTSGKSLVLSLIDYCLGKKSIPLKVQVELNQHTDSVFLEIEFGNDVYTISRGLKKEISNFYVYYSDFLNISEFMPEKLSRKELQSFLMEQIGAIEFKRKKNKQRSEELTTETISFRDIFRYCYVHQHDLGTHNFLSFNEYMVRYKNPIAFEMIFSLVDNFQNDVQSQIVEAQNSINHLNKRRENLLGYLEQRGNLKFGKLLDQIGALEEQISKYNNRKEQLLHQQSGINKDVGENSDFVLITNEIRKIDGTIDSLKREIKRGVRGIESNKMLLNDYFKEKNDIKITEEINYKLRISEHILKCPLCHSEIENTFSEEISKPNTEKVFKTLFRDLDNKISMVSKIVETSEASISEKENQIKYFSRKKEILLMAANEFSKDIQTPYLPELNSINVTISNIEKDKEILIESKRVHKKIAEIEDKIESANLRLDSLNSRMKEIENNQLRKNEIVSELNKTYINNMRGMKYDDLSDTYIDNKNYVPYFRDASVYEHESGGLLECMQISYLDAIVSSENSINHPKFLMFDSVSKYFGTIKSTSEEILEEDIINDPEVYQNIFQLFLSLSSEAQIIIVENTPPEEMGPYVKYTFRNGIRGFIDLEKNEFYTSESEEE